MLPCEIRYLRTFALSHFRTSVKLRFLGTGTSFGVPVIGCRCEVCHSADPRDRRTRHAALLEDGGCRLLIDTPPELRLQLVAAGVREVDAVGLNDRKSGPEVAAADGKPAVWAGALS